MQEVKRHRRGDTKFGFFMPLFFPLSGELTGSFPSHLGLCSLQQIGPFFQKEIITLQGAGSWS